MTLSKDLKEWCGVGKPCCVCGKTIDTPNNMQPITNRYILSSK